MQCRAYSSTKLHGGKCKHPGTTEQELARSRKVWEGPWGRSRCLKDLDEAEEGYGGMTIGTRNGLSATSQVIGSPNDLQGGTRTCLTQHRRGPARDSFWTQTPLPRVSSWVSALRFGFSESWDLLWLEDCKMANCPVTQKMWLMLISLMRVILGEKNKNTFLCHKGL